MSSWLVYVIVAAVVIAAVALVLSLRARRRRQATTTIGLPDLGAVSGDPAEEKKRDEPTPQRSGRPAS